MTAEYLEISSRNLSVVFGSHSNSVSIFVFATVFLCYLQEYRGISPLYKSWIVQRWLVDHVNWENLKATC